MHVFLFQSRTLIWPHFDTRLIESKRNTWQLNIHHCFHFTAEFYALFFCVLRVHAQKLHSISSLRLIAYIACPCAIYNVYYMIMILFLTTIFSAFFVLTYNPFVMRPQYKTCKELYTLHAWLIVDKVCALIVTYKTIFLSIVWI